MSFDPFSEGGASVVDAPTDRPLAPAAFDPFSSGGAKRVDAPAAAPDANASPFDPFAAGQARQVDPLGDDEESFKLFRTLRQNGEKKGVGEIVGAAVKGFVSDLYEGAVEWQSKEFRRAIGVATLDPDVVNEVDREKKALLAVSGAKVVSGYKTLLSGAVTTAERGVDAAKAAMTSDPDRKEQLAMASDRALWNFLRSAKKTEETAAGFNKTLEAALPTFFKGIGQEGEGQAPVNQQAAGGVAQVMDPLNFLGVGAGARLAKVPLKGAIDVAEQSMKQLAAKAAETQAVRISVSTVLKSGEKALATLPEAGVNALKKTLKTSEEADVAAQKALQEATAAYQQLVEKQTVELAEGTVGKGVVDQVVGAALRTGGSAAEKIGDFAEKFISLPRRLAQRLAPGNEVVQNVLDERVLTPVATGAAGMAAVGVPGIVAGVAPAALKVAGRDMRIIGKIVAEGESQIPFFRRVAQETQGLTGYMSSALDTSGLARPIEAAVRVGKRGAEMAPVMAAVGFTGSGGQEEGAIAGAGTGALLGMSGGAIGEWRRLNNPGLIKVQQQADISRYRDTMLPDQKKWFDVLPGEQRLLLSTLAQAHPDLKISFQRMGPDGVDGFHYLDADGSVAVVNMDTKRPIATILAHEIGHHLEKHGLTNVVVEHYVGNADKNIPGIFTLRDAKGVPVKDGAGGYKTTPEFEQLRKVYNERLKASPGWMGKGMLERGDREIARELFAEQAADALLEQKPNGALSLALHQQAGPIAKAAQLLSESDLVAHSGFLKKALGKMGLLFQQDGVVSGSGLFGEQRRSPEMQKLVNQYYRRSKPPAISEEESAGMTVDATDIRRDPTILDRLFDGSGEIARGKDGRVLMNPDGTPQFLRPKDVEAKNAALSARIGSYIEQNATKLPEGALRKVQRVDANGNVRTAYEGRYIPDELLKQLASENEWNPTQIRNLEAISNVLKAGSGGTFSMFYQPASKKGSSTRYRTLRGDYRTEAPYVMEVTKDANVVIKTVSREKLVRNAERLVQQGRAGLWNNHLPDLLADVDVYLNNHAAGRPGADGIGEAKRNQINELFGIRLPSNAEVNPLFQEVVRSKKDLVIQSRRLDRINRMVPVESEKTPFTYQKVKYNFRPGEPAAAPPPIKK